MRPNKMFFYFQSQFVVHLNKRKSAYMWRRFSSEGLVFQYLYAHAHTLVNLVYL